MKEFYKKESKLRFWCFSVPNVFVVGENLRRQVLSKNFNAAHPRKRESQIEDVQNHDRKPKLKI